MMQSTLYRVRGTPASQMVLTRLPRSHRWHLCTRPIVTPRSVSRCRRNSCPVSVGRRWQLPSRWRLLQVACKPDDV